MTIHRSSKRNRGFTLIELLVVVAIISMLSSVVLAQVSTVKKKSVTIHKNEVIRQYTLALEGFYTTHGGYPPPGNNYYICMGLQSTESCWGGAWYGDDNIVNNQLAPYISKVDSVINESLVATRFSNPPVVEDYRGILYIQQSNSCYGNPVLCQGYSMIWFVPGIRQDCGVGYRVRCGTDVNQFNPYGITRCQVNVPAQPDDGDATWC